MTENTRTRFLEAGLRLYPQYGCQKLTVRLLSAETGLSLGMFHHHFASKDAFIGELLTLKYETALAGMMAQAETGTAPERLRQAVFFIAVFVRDNLNWINRVLDDSSYGDEAVNRFLKQHATRHVAPLLALIRQADKTAQAAKNVPIQRFAFLMSSVNGPMITGDHLIGCGLWPSEFEGQFAPQILSDEAIKQRIDWAFAALFPDAAQAPESN